MNASYNLKEINHESMTDKSRQYKPTTVRRLDTLSGGQCAAPNCSKPLIARDGETLLSKIAHIEGASPKGPRYNHSMDVDERRHYNNLILLCDECHSMIDNKENEDKYPVELLQEWKKSHESMRLHQLSSNPSILKLAISAIADTAFEEDDQNKEVLDTFKIEDKIKHNAVKRNKYLIEEYKVYHTKINGIYAELENQGSFKKEKLLRIIRHLYLKTKGAYVADATNPLAIIQERADDIFEDIENALQEVLDKNEARFSEETIFALPIIMVDAFMRCKILEQPPRK
ncbi:MAG: hypothetical protein HQK84_03070 [Nitrospinae bacterium]|nr:hypothetical protein [Nitrospinota bacterium]